MSLTEFMQELQIEVDKLDELLKRPALYWERPTNNNFVHNETNQESEVKALNSK